MAIPSFAEYNNWMSSPEGQAARQKYFASGRSASASDWAKNPVAYMSGFGTRGMSRDPTTGERNTFTEADYLRLAENASMWDTNAKNPGSIGATPLGPNTPTLEAFLSNDPSVRGDNAVGYEYLNKNFNMPQNKGDLWERFAVPAMMTAFTMGAGGGYFPTSGFEGLGTFGSSAAAAGGNIFGNAGGVVDGGSPGAFDYSFDGLNLAEGASTVGGVGPSTGFGVTGGATTGAGGIASFLQKALGIAPGETAGIPDILKKLGLDVGGVSGLASIISGIVGKNKADQTRDIAERAATMENPFGGERAHYAQLLRQLYADPSQVERLPGYKAGLQAVERRMNSQGYGGSGNMMLALHDYGGKMFDSEAARLARLAGADFAPGGGRELLAGNSSANDLLSKALGSLGYGVKAFEDIFG
jgi:hypothetical protein